jgi:hypothetical protein
MHKFRIQLLLLCLGSFCFFSTCKEIKDEWLTPEWIVEKITILNDDCYYEGSSINRYIIDTVEYIDIFIPSNLWPEQNVYYEDGQQVLENDTNFNYNDFEETRGTAVETIWSYPENNSCS